MMGTLARRGSSVVAMCVVMLACVGGCCCGPPERSNCDAGVCDADIAFTFPRDGDVLNQGDDADGDTSNGIQVDPTVRVAYNGEVGTELTLTSDQGEMAMAAVEEDGFARFAGFTVLAAPADVALTVTDGDIEDEINIEVELPVQGMPPDPEPEPEPEPDPPPVDGGAADAGKVDGGAGDAGVADGGPLDAGGSDAVMTDAGPVDAGAP
jgi:hypothetical protein